MVATFEAASTTICPAAADVLELLLNEDEFEEELELRLELELEVTVELTLELELDEEDLLEVALDVEPDIEELLAEDITLDTELAFPTATAAARPLEQALNVQAIVTNSAFGNNL